MWQCKVYQVLGLLLAASHIYAASSTSSSVLVKSIPAQPLRVAMGQRVDLNTRNLVIFNRAKSGTLCHVEVDVNDPMYQKVGQLYPKRFNCFYKPGSVYYQHEGSPLLTNDQVKVYVYYFFGQRNNIIVDHTVLKVKIKSLKESLSTYRVVQLGPRKLYIDNFKETSHPITSDIIRLKYNPLKQRCSVIYQPRRQLLVTAFRIWPLAGKLVTDEGKDIRETRFDCQEFLLKGYRYQHLKPPAPRTDYLPIEIQLEDLNGPSQLIQEHIHLPVKIRRGQKNSPPLLSVKNRPLVLKNTGNSPLVLSESGGSNFLEVRDRETSRDQIVLKVISLQETPTVPGASPSARLIHLKEPSRQITSFLFGDFLAGHVAFQKLTLSSRGLKNYMLKLQPVDSEFQLGVLIPVLLQTRLEESLGFQIFVKPVVVFSKSSVQLRPDNIQSGVHNQLIRYKVRKGHGGAPRNGLLKVDGSQHSRFTSTNLYSVLGSSSTSTSRSGVVYQHKSGLALHDGMKLRANYRRKSLHFNLPIHVVRLWSVTSTLKSRVTTGVIQGGQVCFGTNILQETHLLPLLQDGVNLKYALKVSPRFGKLSLVRKSTALIPVSGKPLLFFSLRDLQNRFLCYHHQGQRQEQDDFKVRQVGSPNLPESTIRVHVRNLPENSLRRLAPARTTVDAEIPETEKFFILGRQILHYATEGEPINKIFYRITVFPTYVNSENATIKSGSDITIDAGRIIDERRRRRESVTGDGVTAKRKVRRLQDLGTLTQWTQEDVHAGRVLYITPVNDIGYLPKTVAFLYTVSDIHGNQLNNQTVLIRLTPVDNKPPSVRQGKLVVQRGKRLLIKPKQLQAVDVDTPADRLYLRLVKPPKHGSLHDGTQRMLVNHRFRADRITKGKISYKHDASAFRLDYFKLQVTDGFRFSDHVTIYLNITRRTEWDYGRTLYANKTIFLREGETITLYPAMFPESKLADTEPHRVAFFLAQSPTKGSILRDSGKVTQFNYKDLKSLRIKYTQNSGEIGPVAVGDIANVMMLERMKLQSHRLNFSIQPVNNQPPKIIVGSQLLVREGGEALISYNVLSAADIDTLPSDLSFRVVDRPNWGEILVSGERREPVRFNMQDINEGRVAYTQNRNQGAEQTHDRFRVVLSDGERSTTPAVVDVYIHPANDEKPLLLLKDFTILKGHSRELDASIFSVSDKDVPKDELRLKIVKLPRLGVLLQRWFVAGIDKTVTKANFRSFTSRNLRSMRLVYVQDKYVTALRDSFEIEVSDSFHKVRKTCNISIRTRNDLGPKLEYSRAFNVFIGSSQTINEDILLVLDPDTPKNQLTYSLIAPPVHGYLEKLTRRSDLMPGGKVVEVPMRLTSEHTFTQLDVAESKLRYTPLRTVTQNETERMTFTCSDAGSRHTLSNIQLVGNISPKPARTELQVVTKRLVVHAGTGVVVNDKSVKVIYGELVVPTAQVKFQVNLPCIKLYKEGLLLSKNAAVDMAAVGSNFVTLNTTTCAQVNQKTSVQIRAEYRGERTSGVLPVSIRKADRFIPAVTRLLTIKVKAGKRAPVKITKNQLRVTDEDTTPNELVFTVRKTPRAGTLLKDGNALTRKSTFTQQDINRGLLSYRHNLASGNDVRYDSFSFTVRDTRPQIRYRFGRLVKTEPLSLLFEIESPDANMLKLINNKVPLMIENFSEQNGRRGRERYGYRITSSFFRVSPRNAVVMVTQQPRYGMLERLGGPPGDVTSFTQSEVNSGKIVYVLHSKLGSETSDYFQFKLRSADMRYTLPKLRSESFRFHLEWSLIKLDKKRYSISCSRGGTLELKVHRVGALDQSAFVMFDLRTPKNKRRAAKLNVDYVPDRRKSVSFAEGENSAKIKVHIIERPRNNPRTRAVRLIVKLRSPSNAVLREPSRAVVLLSTTRSSRDTCNEPHFKVSQSTNPSMAFQYIGYAKRARKTYIRDQSYPSLPGVNAVNRRHPQSLGPSYSIDQSGGIPLPPDTENNNNNKNRVNLGEKAKIFNSRSQNKNNPWDIKLPSSEELNQLGKNSGRSANQKNVKTNQLPNCGVQENYLVQKLLSNGELYFCNGFQWVLQRRQRQCSPTWREHANLCYKVFRARRTWTQAHRACQRHRASLTIVNSQKDLRWFARRLRAGRKYWIGLRYSDRTWKYEDGSALFYKSWDYNYPRPTRRNRKCVFVFRNKYFRNRPCDRNRYRYICMKVKQ